MTECESVRGKWGGICPDCGQRLPSPKPLRSWMGEKYQADKRALIGALALKEKGTAYRFRLHRTDRRAA